LRFIQLWKVNTDNGASFGPILILATNGTLEAAGTEDNLDGELLLDTILGCKRRVVNTNCYVLFPSFSLPSADSFFG